jgi:hypothetical protein
MVMSRKELKDSISESIAKPDAASEARSNTVKMELGQLDGKVSERLAEVCEQSYLRHQVDIKRESS